MLAAGQGLPNHHDLQSSLLGKGERGGGEQYKEEENTK